MAGILVFDCDGENAEKYNDFILDIYGNTFILKSEFGGYHLFMNPMNRF